jgi:hypothetical protein
MPECFDRLQRPSPNVLVDAIAVDHAFEEVRAAVCAKKCGCA